MEKLNQSSERIAYMSQSIKQIQSFCIKSMWENPIPPVGADKFCGYMERGEFTTAMEFIKERVKFSLNMETSDFWLSFYHYPRLCTEMKNGNYLFAMELTKEQTRAAPNSEIGKFWFALYDTIKTEYFLDLIKKQSKSTDDILSMDYSMTETTATPQAYAHC